MGRIETKGAPSPASRDLFCKDLPKSSLISSETAHNSSLLASRTVDSSIEDSFELAKGSVPILEHSVNRPTDSLSSPNTSQEQQLFSPSALSPILKSGELSDCVSEISDEDYFFNSSPRPMLSLLDKVMGVDENSELDDELEVAIGSGKCNVGSGQGGPADVNPNDGGDGLENKIVLKLPFLKPVKGEDTMNEGQDNFTDGGEESLGADLSRPKLPRISKEELRELKLARREADCQLNYGEQESPEYALNMGDEGPFIIGNYITRHTLNRIASIEHRNSGGNPQNTNGESPGLRPNKRDMRSRYLLENKGVAKAEEKKKPYVPGMSVFVRDRWGIWCEAVITKDDYRRVLVKYVDANIDRQEWVSLGHHRLKRMSDMESTALNVEYDSPPVDVTGMVPMETQPAAPPKVYIPGEICSECELPFQEFRYFCLHCPPSDDYICSQCYFHRFSKAHKHSRLLYAKERTLTYRTIMLLKATEHSITRFEQDRIYIHEPVAMQERWGSGFGNAKTQRVTALGIHRHLPGISSSYKPTLIICAFCHDTQYSTSLLTGEFISIDCPFILSPTVLELERREKKPLPDRVSHVDLFWCHINCARFSSMAQVIPKHSITSQDALEANRFYNLGRALRVSNRNSCPRCRERGASISCSKPGCHRYFHLKCTGKPLAFFERGQLFYCRTHETGLRKLPPYTDVIGSISCQSCGGLLPKGRDEIKKSSTTALSIKPREPSSSLNGLWRPDSESANMAGGNTSHQTNAAFSGISNAKSESLDITPNPSQVPGAPLESGLNRGASGIHRGKDVPCNEADDVDVVGEDDATAPNQTWSWYTCQKCIDEDGFYPFDLCQTCFTSGIEGLGHEHSKDDFRWTNYHNAANDLHRSIFLFDPKRPWSKRPSVHEKKKLHTLLSKVTKGLKRKHAEAEPPKTTKKIHCAKCQTTTSNIWRKGYSGILMCMSCFEGVPDQKEEPASEPAPEPKKAKNVPEKIKIIISLKAIEEAHGAPSPNRSSI
ncbi:hypothetical protein DSO57_1032053 [Entomophthora muscae]|uniref:Uncharacterized protein n=1 Tax=Entomophthora muscae TaxID=34485 RepID=A0ACC2TMI6_9FUNG|nr:hypothetical protein DSO57_1032053 [Entomophthora muscae]